MSLKITDVEVQGDVPAVQFNSQAGRTYAIEFSLDLENWEVIAPNHPADGDSTEFMDTGIDTRLGGLPDEAFYRVREN